MSIFVTGGLGVNGSWVTRKLIDRGLRPVVLDTRRDFSLIGPDYEDRMDFVCGDFADSKALSDMFARHDVRGIVHMAAIVGSAQTQPVETFRVNAMGTVALLEAARAAGIKRVVFTSSRGVYGESRGDNAHPVYSPVTEDTPLRPVLVYDVCKAAAEGMGRNFARDFGLEFVALRFSQIFGPGKVARHGNYGILSRMIEAPLKGEEVVVAQGGEQLDDMIYVDDVAEAIVLAIMHERPQHMEYNISRGVGTTLHDLAEAVREVVPDARIKIGGGLDYLGFGVNYSCVMSNARAMSDLGFTPRFDLKSAVKDYIARMRSMGL